MQALAKHSLKAIALAVASVLLLALGAALVRLLPWLLSPEVPVAVALPFAKVLFGAALEAAFLVGVPVGAALGAALLVERGEARALYCQGASPLRLMLQAVPMLIVLASGAGAATLTWQAGSDRPGHFARALVDEARGGCETGVAHSISVPIVGVTWLCFAHAPPRITGPVPNSDGRAWFSATGISVTDDFTAFRANDVFVGTPRHPSGFGFNLRVKQARVFGLPAWGGSSALGGRERALVVTLAVLLLSLSAIGVVLRFGWSNCALAAGFSGLGGVFTLRALHTHRPELDPTFAFFEVLGVGIAVLFVPALVWALLRGVWRLRERRKLA